MRLPRWLQQMRALLGQRAGMPQQPLNPADVVRELDDLDRLAREDRKPTPLLCQRCSRTTKLCRCAHGPLLLEPHPREFDLEGDSHPTLRGGDKKRPSDKPPGRRKPSEGGHQ